MANLTPKDVKISLELVNSLSPQRSMIGATTDELRNQEFLLHSETISVPDGSTDLTDADNKNAGQVKIIYMNTVTNQTFTIPVRTLLGMQVVLDNSDNEEFVPGKTKTMKVHEHLLKQTEGDVTEVSLPKNIKIKGIEDELSRDGKKNKVYPYYMYEEFNKRVKALREEAAKAEVEADLRGIFQDREFINSLYAGKVDDQYKDAEPNKKITIAIV